MHLLCFKNYIKYGKIDGVQRYKCACCGKQFRKETLIKPAIICDGRKGLLQLFEGIPTQMCNFHQVANIRKYLTKNPKMEASKDLWLHALLLTRTDKESFEGGLNDWHTKWKSFLNERKIDAQGRNRYILKRLRSAYRSLKTNLPRLFTWYYNMPLNIPNTTNAIDGHFADLKNKLRKP